MGMAQIQFYRNKYDYPDFSEYIAEYGTLLDCTPVGMNLKTGSLRVSGDMNDFMSCNYIRLERDNRRLYAWITDVHYLTDNSFTVFYKVDPFRTWKDKVTLGNQFIARAPEESNLRDPLLGSPNGYPYVDSRLVRRYNWDKRVFVVQTRVMAGTFAPTPVQPSPYKFYFAQYDVNNWLGNQALVDLMGVLSQGAETQNIVTMYSIPYLDMNGTIEETLTVVTPNDTKTPVAGFRTFKPDTLDVGQYLRLETELDPEIMFNPDLLRRDHSVQIVIPDAGVITIPDELLMTANLRLRQDIDLYTGASNYMLIQDHMVDNTKTFFGLSVRGSVLNSIPVLSDPYDTYVSQNANALGVSLLGDVATMATGAVSMLMPGGAAAGASKIANGAAGMLTTNAKKHDAGSKFSNPPAFLGSALAAQFNQSFWIVTTAEYSKNEDLVHQRYGYPQQYVAPLVMPASGGFIQTQNCSVTSDGTVPQWAIWEMNQLFDDGLRVHSV